MFAAQNCMYIQAVGGDMLRIECQKEFAKLIRQWRYTPCDRGEVRNERGAGENYGVLGRYKTC